MSITPQTILTDLRATLETWETALKRYKDPQLARPLEADGWTLGQVCAHLLDSTAMYHIQHIDHCLEHPEEREGTLSPEGAERLAANAFPDVRIHVPPSPRYTPEQPAGKAELLARLEELQAIIGFIAQRIEATPQSGQAAHPTLGWLDAQQWFQLIAMHWRHHLRQKARLDALLAQ